jgi:hypothetical protein
METIMNYAVERTGSNDILRLWIDGRVFPDVRTSFAKADLAKVSEVLKGAGLCCEFRPGKVLIASIPGMDRHAQGTFYQPLTWDEVMTWAVDRVGRAVCNGIISTETADAMLTYLDK